MDDVVEYLSKLCAAAETRTVRRYNQLAFEPTSRGRARVLDRALSNTIIQKIHARALAGSPALRIAARFYADAVGHCYQAGVGVDRIRIYADGGAKATETLFRRATTVLAFDGREWSARRMRGRPVRDPERAPRWTPTGFFLGGVQFDRALGGIRFDRASRVVAYLAPADGEDGRVLRFWSDSGTGYGFRSGEIDPARLPSLATLLAYEHILRVGEPDVDSGGEEEDPCPSRSL